jgi:cytosine/adenosine deaminase-related metal-dependent hydrolase
MHVSETRDEVYEVKRRTGKFPVEYLGELGLVNNRLHLVHLGWITSWELGMIRENDVKVTHSPTSNMKLATAGFFPMRELMEASVTVTLGTDGPASNNSLDMFREMKVGVLLQRHGYWDTRIRAIHLLKAATVNGYRLMGIRGGSIQPGHVADIVLINTRKPHLQPLRRDNVISALVYSASGNDVDMVMINGKIAYTRDDQWRFGEKAIELSREINEFIAKFQ